MRKKLLLADDSITIQKVVELTFPTDEFEVVTAGNGRIAVDKAMTFLPDIVLCDVIMPQLDGYQVCEALRASADLKDVPILLLNGAFEPYDAARATAVGALGNVSKPFDPPALVARVKEILAERAASAIDQPSMEAIAGMGAEVESAETPIEAPAEFEYDESETHPVSTVEVPLGVREMAARSMSLDAPVFTAAEPEVLNTSEALDSDLQPSDFSETLHGPLDEEVAPVEELPAVDVPAAEEAIEASEELGPIAATGEFEAPAIAEGTDTEPAEFDAETDAAPVATPSAGAELESEREFEPEELAAAATEAETASITEVPEAEAAEAAPAEPEPMAFPEPSAPEPAVTAEPEPEPAPEAIGLPAPAPKAPIQPESAPPPAAVPADALPAATAAPSGEVAVPMDMVQQIAQRVISQVSERVIREIAWDVIPGLAEKLVKAEIERIKARAESERD